MHPWDTESLAFGQAGREFALEVSFLAQPRTHTSCRRTKPLSR